MKTIIKSVLCLAIALISAFQAEGQDRNKPTVIVKTPEDIKSQNTVIPVYYSGTLLYDGATVDSTWNREPLETKIDEEYLPFLPEIPESMTPPHTEPRSVKDPSRAPWFGEESFLYDPYKDETHSIFTNRSKGFAKGATFENYSSRKEIVAIELFGALDGMPLEIMDELRRLVALGATLYTSQYVLDAQAVLGGKYNGDAVAFGGPLDGFHHTKRMDQLYCRGVRYVFSGALMFHSMHKYYEGAQAKNWTYETMMTMMFTTYDLDTRQIIGLDWVQAVGKGSSAKNSEQEAISKLRTEAGSIIRNNIKYTAKVLSPGEPDKKGKIKTCTISAGKDMDVKAHDLFAVHYASDPDGASIGRLKVTAVSEDCSDCKITIGAPKVQAAFEEGKELVLISDGQSLF